MSLENQSMLIEFILIIIFENFELKVFEHNNEGTVLQYFIEGMASLLWKEWGKEGGFNLLTNQIGKKKKKLRFVKLIANAQIFTKMPFF